MDLNTTLCLACSSSLPPSKSTLSSFFSKDNSIYITKCCQRPICPSCIASNPRLARYDPCLACLGGVGVVASGSGSQLPSSGKGMVLMSPGLNLDGSVRDEATFILGDDEDDNDDDNILDNAEERSTTEVAPPPPYEAVAVPSTSRHNGDVRPSVKTPDTYLSGRSSGPLEQDFSDTGESILGAVRTVPYKYYLDKRDTLQGIALRFGLDVFEICRLNNLPPSVLRTMPHLLHTRAFLLLPPTAKPHPSLAFDEAEEQGREEKLVRERARKKLQTLTKEVDWRIAKAYVALADDAQEQDAYTYKRKENGITEVTPTDGRVLEALAIEQYLEDEEWEAKERRAGRNVGVPRFPIKGKEKMQTKKGW
ncbi:hypothetical protein CPB84DRAFT_1768912 [Gymnopilus junonius]|uniref:LysM domain-containing protein n=1 Tax=Gymnopilus junonius TaxID=109634 RepID=A0A9P5NSQ3_GYMJU|nr:hypothetical protein CPB84DRAFT_1768912 [Gymnopilus junonius]